jgi:hypothetical protein
LGYREVDIEIQGPRDKEVFCLVKVTYYKDFAYNLVLLQQLHKHGLWWDNHPRYNYLRKANLASIIVAELQEKYYQFIIEYIPNEVLQLVFFIQRNIFNSRTEKWPSTIDALKWHLWLGHPGLEALRHLVNCTTGIKIKGIPTFECEACAVAKAKQQI